MSDTTQNKISERKKRANRLNAKNSTGPKTETGKEIASRNSVKHGLYARDVVINAPHLKENPAEYEQLLASLIEELEPATAFQEHLVRKIANCIWRSRRAVIAETAEINYRIENLDDNGYFTELLDKLKQIPCLPPEPGLHDDMQETRAMIAQSIANYIGRRSIPQIYDSNNILRYEMRLDRQMTRAYKLLKHLKGQNAANSQLNDLDEN